MITIDTTGKTASEILAMRNDLRLRGTLPGGATWSPAMGNKYAAISALTAAWEKAAKAEGHVVVNGQIFTPSAPRHRTCCSQGVVENAAPYAYAVRCPCHGYRTHGTAD